MACLALVTGDDINLPVQLLCDGEPFTISASATVRASIISRTGQVVGPVTLHQWPGSDWANSLVIVRFPRALSLTMAIGAAELQVKVDDGIEETWVFEPIYVKRGYN